MQCKKEQGLSSNRSTKSLTMPNSIESSTMSDSTSQIEHHFVSKNLSHYSSMLEFDQQVVVTECGIVHMVNPLPSTLSHENIKIEFFDE